MEEKNLNDQEIIEKIDDYELFESVIDNFILEIDALAESLPLVMGLVAIKFRNSSKELDEFIDKNTQKVKGDEKSFKIPLNEFNNFNRLDNDLKSSEAAYNILPRTFIVSLVSQYDAYLGELYRTLFAVKPKLAFSLEKEMSIQEILKYEDIEELKDFVIEKEIESLLRENHFEQIKILEKRITKISSKNFTLTSDLNSLPDFIEVTERRNLFVHCNGIVSRQYLEICKKYKVRGIDKIKIDEQLSVDPIYFQKAYNVIFEIGVKLGQVLWRKFLPDKLIEADKNINNICYDLLYSGYYDLAKELLHFATEVVPKNGSDELRKTLIVNKALAYYLSDDMENCNLILDKEDWSIGDIFKFAVFVLKENYEDAKKIMLKIGAKDEVCDKDAYQEWPLFKKFRESKQFKETFKKLFKEEYIIREAPEKSFIKLLDSIKEKQKKLN